jgi:glycoprotein endo-alpha-1,2-mannosidase
MSQQKANVNLWVASWWGPEKPEDVTLRDSILSVLEKEDSSLKIALFYESKNRLKEWKLDKDVVKDDIKHMEKEYWKHPNYYRIDGKPVIFIYLTRVLQDVDDKGKHLLEETVALMRSKAKEPIYIVGDHAYGRYPDDATSSQAARNIASFAILDAITSYGVRGYMIGRTNNMYAGQDRVDFYYEQQAIWKQVAADHDCAFIPSVSPGYNDRGVRAEKHNLPLSRRLTAESEEGSFFRASIQAAKRLVDPAADNLLVVNSWNEWHEDSQIEPVAILDDATDEPFALTNGLSYMGYGDLYLDILWNETAAS